MNRFLPVRTRIVALLLIAISLLICNTFSLPAKTTKKKTITSSKSIKSSKKSKKRKKSRRSRCKRSYNPELTRTNAIKFLQESSKDLSMLAGVDTLIAQSLSDEDKLDLNEGEVLDNPEESDIDSNDMDSQGELFAELEREDDVRVDINEFKDLWLAFADDGNPEYTEGGFKKEEMMYSIMEWLGTPYYFGGVSNSGIDCSAFTRMIYSLVGDGYLPRTASSQFATLGKSVNRNDLQFGDLVFFNTRRRVFVSHVGIYLGDNIFAHASSRYGVTFSSLESTYYSKRFIGARRVYTNDFINPRPTTRTASNN